MAFKIAIQLFSLRDDAAADFFGTLEKVKAMGYDGVEFAGLYGNSIPSFLRVIANRFTVPP